MLPLVAALTLATAQIEPPRLRTVLPNGAAILVEPMQNERVVSIQLWASSRGVEERPETHGLRHILEHILALGPKKDLDPRLEMVGGYLSARTLRDATQIEIQVPKEKLDLGMRAVYELLQPLNTSPEEIGKQTRVIGQEIGMREDDSILSEAAWRSAYGQSALDPFGDLEVMRAATPEDLESIRKRQYSPANLVLVVAGPVGLDSTTSEARKILAPLKGVEERAPKLRLGGLPGSAAAEAFGEARAALVPEFASMKAVSSLAAALAVASELEDCYVTYTPSAQNGLVIIGRTEAKEGVSSYIDSLDTALSAGLYNRGRSLATSWVQRQLRSASGTAYLRGLLMAQGHDNRPEMMLESIGAMTPADFVKGVSALKRANAVSVVGSE